MQNLDRTSISQVSMRHLRALVPKSKRERILAASLLAMMAIDGLQTRSRRTEQTTPAPVIVNIYQNQGGDGTKVTKGNMAD